MAQKTVNNVRKNIVPLTTQIIHVSEIPRFGINCIYKLHAMNICTKGVKLRKDANVGVINK